jgi:hypothetical protein
MAAKTSFRDRGTRTLNAAGGGSGPENIVALVGMPRSGTTIISRLIANHSRIRTIIEPYHTRREAEYCETDPVQLCTDYGVVPTANTSLLVKETATREINIRLIGELLKRSTDTGFRAGYVFVLRSPIECFLSQKDATETLWAKPKRFGDTESSIKMFWNSFRRLTAMHLEFALRYHRRFVIYDRFVEYPREEVGRLMTLFGYGLEAAQLDISSPNSQFGGDPKARGAFSKTIAEGDRFRTAEAAGISERWNHIAEFRGMQRVHNYVKQVAAAPPQAETMIKDLAVLAEKNV